MKNHFYILQYKYFKYKEIKLLNNADHIVLLTNKVKDEINKLGELPIFVARKPNKKKMLELARSGYITATDLAAYIVKNHTRSFREAYQKTAAIINMAEKRKKKLDELTLYDLKKIEPNLTKDVLKVFDLNNSVNSKKSYGGTAFDNIKKMIIKYKKQL